MQHRSKSRFVGFHTLAASFAVIPLLQLAACRGEPEALHDEGRLCLASDEREPFSPWAEQAPVTLRAGEALYVQVQAQTCLRSSCDVDRRASCAVKQEGSVLTVESQLRWTSDARRACTDDCGKLAARCESSPLPAGTYTVRHGPRERTIEVPGVLTTPCDE